MTQTTGQRGNLGAKVAGVFSTKVIAFAIAFCTSLMISLVLDKAGKGAYGNLIGISGIAGALGVLGLPTAINYYSARNVSTRGLLVAGIVFSTILSVLLIGVIWLLLPWLRTNVFKASADFLPQQYWMLAVIPPALLTTFTMAVLLGRQQVRTYSLILVSQGLLTFIAATLFVAVLHLGIPGAIAATGGVIWLIAIVDVIAVFRLSRSEPGEIPTSYRSMFAYGLRIYPASITSYFNYRIDTYLIPIFLVARSPEEVAAQLGLYFQATTMAELLFYVPDSISTVFLPRTAGLSHEQSSVLVGRVSRLTVLLTAIGAVGVIVASYIGIHLILPTFTNSLPACYILLPGIMMLSISKVMSSYVAGRGHPGPISAGSTIAVVANVVANVVLIPQFGIVGASLASVISYSVSAIWLLNVASRISGRSILSLVVPGREEVAWVVDMTRRVLGRGIATVRRPKSGEAAS